MEFIVCSSIIKGKDCSKLINTAALRFLYATELIGPRYSINMKTTNEIIELSQEISNNFCFQ